QLHGPGRGATRDVPESPRRDPDPPVLAGHPGAPPRRGIARYHTLPVLAAAVLAVNIDCDRAMHPSPARPASVMRPCPNQLVQDQLSSVVDGRLVEKRKKPVHEGPAQTMASPQAVPAFRVRALERSRGAAHGLLQ